MNKVSRYHKGVLAERVAALFLILKGYRVLEMRYKTHVGEVDIIARKGRTFVFAEVKYRATYEEGIHSISQQAKTRIMRSADYYRMKNLAHEEMDMRFDALILSPPFYIKHLRNAWTL